LSGVKSPAEIKDDCKPTNSDIKIVEVSSEVFSEIGVFCEDSNQLESTSLGTQVSSKDSSENASETEQYSKLSPPEKSSDHIKCANDSSLQLRLFNDSIASKKEQNFETFEKRNSLLKTGSFSKFKRGKAVKLLRRHSTPGAPRRSKHFHQGCRSRWLDNFLNDNECHFIWKPNSVNKTTSSEAVQKKASTISTFFSSDVDTPVDLCQKQKQLLERVAVAREVAKDQNVTLVQPDISHFVKQRSLRLSSRYISFRMSKKYEGGEGDTQGQQKANKIPLPGEKNNSQSLHLSSKSKDFPTNKKIAPKACNRYTVMSTKPSRDDTSNIKTAERQDFIKMEYFTD